MSAGCPLVSVIVPVYNGAALLGQAVRSVLTQPVRDLELLIVDDGSEDDTPSVAGAAASSDARVLFLRQAHQGASAARNLGLLHARGRYVAFLDHDDAWVPGFLSPAVWQLLRDTQAAVCVFGYCITDSRMRRCSPRCLYTHTVAGGRALHELWGHHGAMLFLRTHLLSNGLLYPPLTYSEDVQFAARAMAAARQVCFFRRPMLLYRRRAGSLTRLDRSPDELERIVKSWLDLKDWFLSVPEPGPSGAFWRDTVLACTLSYLRQACACGVPLSKILSHDWLGPVLQDLPEHSQVRDLNRLRDFSAVPGRFWLCCRLSAPLQRLGRLRLPQLVSDRLLLRKPLPVLEPDEL